VVAVDDLRKPLQIGGGFVADHVDLDHEVDGQGHPLIHDTHLQQVLHPIQLDFILFYVNGIYEQLVQRSHLDGVKVVCKLLDGV
jgi:hypothetical protein